MTHVYHQTLPGYTDQQILVDGCPECEARGRRDDCGLANLDNANFVKAWLRAIAWNEGAVHDISKAEAPLLNMLYRVGRRLLYAPQLAQIDRVTVAPERAEA